MAVGSQSDPPHATWRDADPNDCPNCRGLPGLLKDATCHTCQNTGRIPTASRPIRPRPTRNLELLPPFQGVTFDTIYMLCGSSHAGVYNETGEHWRVYVEPTRDADEQWVVGHYDIWLQDKSRPPGTAIRCCPYPRLTYVEVKHYLLWMSTPGAPMHIMTADLWRKRPF